MFTAIKRGIPEPQKDLFTYSSKVDFICGTYAFREIGSCLMRLGVGSLLTAPLSSAGEKELADLEFKSRI